MSTPAGWYPQDDGQQRYWDGTQWTEHFAPGTAAGPAAGSTADAAGATAVSDTTAYSYTTPVGADGGLGTGAYPAANTAAAQRPWFKKKRFLIPGGAVALILVASMASAAGGGGSTPEPTSAAAGLLSASSTPTPTAEPVEATATPTPTKAVAKPTPAPTKAAPVVDKTPKFGTKVRDGKFEFVVTGMKCGISKVGTQYFNTKAQGQFCRVSMTITNIGDEPQTMFADNQVAFDSKKRQFSADSEASIYDGKSEVLFEEINPGNTVKGRVYFDVPKNAKLVKIELHDSMFSGGVDVALRK
jgi:hypothetical protein